MTDSYQQLINDVQETLSYAGFNAVTYRKRVVSEFDREDVVKILMIYIMTGNAIGDKVSKKKVSNVEEAKAYVKFLKEKKVLGKKSTLDSYTITRFALAFPALVIKIRSALKPMTPRVETSTPWHLQDLCLNSFLSEDKAKEAEDFITKFSLILSKAADPTVTDAAAKDKLLNFRKIGSAAHALDEVGMKAFKLDFSSSIDVFLTAYGFEEVALSFDSAVSKVQRAAISQSSLSKEAWSKLGYVAATTGSEGEKTSKNTAEKKRVYDKWVSEGA